MQKNKMTIPDLVQMKSKAEKITILTAYDFPMASIIDQAGIDAILVGDSLGNVVLGYESTVPVTMEEMLHHIKAVKRGTKRAVLIGDMPFMSFNISIEESIFNAGRFIKEGGADAVKVEGGNGKTIATVKAIVEAGIPVMGHLGLTPQTACILGGYKVQGKNAEKAKEILQQAQALESAGCFSIVLECVPDKLSEVVTQKLKVPTISCGAGSACDGQVLVIHDMLGMYEHFVPKFVKQYANLTKEISRATQDYIQEVRQGKYPGQEHIFNMDQEEVEKLGC
ncbi:MAG: 3-methyl-2-oxobutanoate hydroxymethyltransferase [PVC group bacterium]|nr:3-methyl-2-oxobutanoate hydroxymethyltransferase [PVC group bacterium]